MLAVADQLSAVAENVRAAAVRSQQALSGLVTHTERLHELSEVDVDAAADALRGLSSSLAPVSSMHSQLAAATELVLDVVRPPLEAGSDTAGWAAVAELAEQPAQVLTALMQHDRRSAATTRLRQAARQIDLGVQSVLDRRLLRMGGKIRRWWALLRPDELTTFDVVLRRGTGRKYLDVTATLAPQPATAGVVRNALAVFSNSQLNVLGLSAFLAPCQLRSHRSSSWTTRFRAVTASTATPSPAMWSPLCSTADSRSWSPPTTASWSGSCRSAISTWASTSSAPRSWTPVPAHRSSGLATIRAAHARCQQPGALPLLDNRRAAGNALRIAAERLAKHVIVAGRRPQGDTTASLAEYDNKNLKDLRVLATQHAIRPNEPGRWQQLARTLTTPTTTRSTRRHPSTSSSAMPPRDLKRLHLQNDPLLTGS
ncbi:MAG: hypothetical protein JWN77_3160 [Frankiales bacterium]|nr:hypothetical protein [Frankiales bacterium]